MSNHLRERLNNHALRAVYVISRTICGQSLAVLACSCSRLRLAWHIHHYNLAPRRDATIMHWSGYTLSVHSSGVHGTSGRPFSGSLLSSSALPRLAGVLTHSLQYILQENPRYVWALRVDSQSPECSISSRSAAYGSIAQELE